MLKVKQCWVPICILNQSIKNDLEVANTTRSFFVFLIPGGIGIWKCWFLRRGKNRSTRRKTSQSHKKGPTTNSTHLWRPRQHWDPRLIGGRRVLHHCTILVHSWPLTSAKMLFTRPKSGLRTDISPKTVFRCPCKIPNLVLFFFEITLSSFI